MENKNLSLTYIFYFQICKQNTPTFTFHIESHKKFDNNTNTMNKIQKNEENKHQQYGYCIPIHSMVRTKLSNALGVVNIKDNDGNLLKYKKCFCQKKKVN